MMSMGPRPQALLVDIAIGLLAGLAATVVTNLAQGPLHWLTPRRAEQRERRVRPGETSSLAAAKRASELLKLSADGQQAEMLGTGIHFVVGTGWGLVYPLLRRGAGLGPLGGGLATGAAMSLLLDEGLVPALGLSARNRDYPLATHVRGFAAHLVYGAAVALAAEGVGRLGRGIGSKQSFFDKNGQTIPAYAPCSATLRARSDHHLSARKKRNRGYRR